ncbi:MAG: hypothetical protein IS632_01445 [Thaumarchaeota archaeon]|nr:hypothetical protein [Nitrososphaerota archaeon]
MRPRTLLLVVVPAAALAAFAFGVIYQERPGYLSYGDEGDVRQDLEAVDIQMSSAVRLSGSEAAEYCSFLSDRSAPVSHCLSTELESGDTFLGNIHLAGTPGRPALALGVVQSDGVVAEKDKIAVVADSMIRHMACADAFDLTCALLGGPDTDATRHMPCSCPQAAFPDGQDSVERWVDQTVRRHLEGDSPTTRSSVEGLPIPVLLEATRTGDGHLWKILVGPVP